MQTCILLLHSLTGSQLSGYFRFRYVEISIGSGLTRAAEYPLFCSVMEHRSVAERVAWERGEAVGKSVGYAMPLEISPPRARGSILYCTTRMLLHSLQV